MAEAPRRDHLRRHGIMPDGTGHQASECSELSTGMDVSNTPVARSQLRAVSSVLPVASQVPSGEIATALTPPMWPMC